MRFDHLPGTNVARFPVERRAAPTLLIAQELAPRQDLAEAMADERAAGEPRADTMATAAEAFTSLVEALEFGMGEDAAVAHLRALVEVQVKQACALGWQYRDAEADAEAAAAQLKAARAAGAVAAVDGLNERVRRSRALWADAALSARAAADAAAGAQAALDFHERGETWRRPGSAEGAGWLDVLEAKLPARRDGPVLPV